MKLFKITAVVFFLASMQLACTSPQSNNTQTTEMSVKNQLDHNAMIVDVRTPEEFAESSYPGAVNIPLDQIKNRISEFQGKPGVVVYCRSGKRSSEAKEILESNGIKNVTNGINADNIRQNAK